MIGSLKSTLEDAGVRPYVGFVPTMGALHAGHAQLIKKSSKENAITVVSVFVNPKQFAAHEDLDKYPRTFEADCDLCLKAGAQIVFAPSMEAMYPEDFRTKVSVDELSSVLCGAHRPDHFSGVCTVVLLLLNFVSADKAYFGLKDYQQFAIINRMTLDIVHPTRIIGVPTVREADGLAMSSRNRYLDEKARAAAAVIPRSLRAAAECFLSGETKVQVVLDAARASLNSVQDFEVQYCELRNAKNLTEMTERISHESVLAIAGFVQNADGVKTRLIDNIILTHEPDRLETLLDFVRIGSTSK
jgi:pantoate--beta-alanine ligase